jgi:type I restriction enzyme S subunit
MTRWQTKPLRELCDTVAERAKEGAFPYIEIGNIIPQTKGYLFSEKSAVKGALVGKADDILISRVRPTRGAIAIVEDRHIAVSSAFTVLRCRQKIRARFLHFALAWNKTFLTYLGNRAKGALYPTVQEKDILAFEVPVPPLPEQERVAELLNEAKLLKDFRAQNDRCTATLIPALFQEMFGDVIANNKDFPIERLDKCIRLLGGAAFKSTDFCDDGIPVIRIGNANKGELDLNDLVFLPKSFTQQYARYLLNPGDIVITLTGTVGKNDYGNVCFVNDQFDKWFLNQRVAKVEFADNRLLSAWYLFWAFRQPRFKAMLIRNNRGVRQANISNKDILSLEIPLPPLAMQNEFAQRVTEIRALEAAQATSRTRLDALFQSMLHRAFNGEL